MVYNLIYDTFFIHIFNSFQEQETGDKISLFKKNTYALYIHTNRLNMNNMHELKFINCEMIFIKILK